MFQCHNIKTDKYNLLLNNNPSPFYSKSFSAALPRGKHFGLLWHISGRQRQNFVRQKWCSITTRSGVCTRDIRNNLEKDTEIFYARFEIEFGGGFCLIMVRKLLSKESSFFQTNLENFVKFQVTVGVKLLFPLRFNLSNETFHEGNFIHPDFCPINLLKPRG